MEDEILFFENSPIAEEKQDSGWEIYLAILTSLIELDLFCSN
jgi:hypothetical protein